MEDRWQTVLTHSFPTRRSSDLEVFVPENANVRKQDSDPGYETEPLKQRDEEDEGILYDNLD